MLKLVKLDSAARVIQGDGNGLDGFLKENGGNVSFGQRQLLCLARALLQSSRIVCVEEAALCVDSSVETMIQRVSARARVSWMEFCACTCALSLHLTLVPPRRS